MPYDTICPVCPRNAILRTKRATGRHLKTNIHQSLKSKLGNHEDERSKMLHDKLIEWEMEHDAENALEEFVISQEQRERERIQNRSYLQRNPTTENCGLFRITATEGVLDDKAAFTIINEITRHSPFMDEGSSSLIRDEQLYEETHESLSDESYYESDNEMQQVESESNGTAEPGEEEDCFFDDQIHLDEEISELQSELEEVPQRKDEVYGDNPFFQTSFFTQDIFTPTVKQPFNDWYPFGAKIDAVLYLFCMQSKFSQKQLASVWWLLRQLMPGQPIPSLKQILAYRTKLPKPEIRRFYDMESRPYYQISILDIIRMQFGMPDSMKDLHEMPEVVKQNMCLEELWHGSKWLNSPQMQSPVHLLNGIESPVWIGDIITLKQNEHNVNHALFLGKQKEKINQEFIEFIRVLPIFWFDEDEYFIIPTKDGFIKGDAISIDERICSITGINQIDKESILGCDIHTHEMHKLSDPIHKQLSFQHPLRAYYNKAPISTPVRIANISLWNDGMSGVRGKRWNPFEIWSMSFAGLPHRTNFHPSANIMIAAAQHVKASSVISPIVQELKRLQRGILVFDASTNSTAFVCGSLVQGLADNPAASDLISHMWKSSHPCRVCLYCPADVKLPADIGNISALRDAQKTCLLENSKIAYEYGIKLPLTDFYSLPGLDPHQDWPMEILHTIYLGLVKYLWIQTKEDQVMRPYLANIALAIDAASYENIPRKIRGRRIANWSASFNGSDYKILVQILPAVLFGFFARQDTETWEKVADVVKIWSIAGKLTNLLCLPAIENIEKWGFDIHRLVTNFISLWSKRWSQDSLIKKTKIHQLFHVPEWARRFGPPIIAIAETHEAGNKHIRRQLELSNRLAASRDCALKYAHIYGLRYIAQGGVWREDEDGTMTQAGSCFLTFCKDTTTRRFLGLPQPKLQIEGRLFHSISNASISATQCHSLWHIQLPSNTSYSRFSQFRRSREGAMIRGRLGTFVQIQGISSIYRIKALIRCDNGSPNIRIGQELVVLELQQDVSPIDEDMLPTLRGSSQLVIKALSQIEEVLNVQHLCTRLCQPQRVASAYQKEREIISGLVWLHDKGDEWVLNTNVLKYRQTIDDDFDEIL